MSLTKLVCRSLANSLTGTAVEQVSEGAIWLKNGIVVVIGDDVSPEILSRKGTG